MSQQSCEELNPKRLNSNHKLDPLTSIYVSLSNSFLPGNLNDKGKLLSLLSDSQNNNTPNQLLYSNYNTSPIKGGMGDDLSSGISAFGAVYNSITTIMGTGNPLSMITPAFSIINTFTALFGGAQPTMSQIMTGINGISAQVTSLQNQVNIMNGELSAFFNFYVTLEGQGSLNNLVTWQDSAQDNLTIFTNKIGSTNLESSTWSYTQYIQNLSTNQESIETLFPNDPTTSLQLAQTAAVLSGIDVKNNTTENTLAIYLQYLKESESMVYLNNQATSQTGNNYNSENSYVNWYSAYYDYNSMVWDVVNNNALALQSVTAQENYYVQAYPYTHNAALADMTQTGDLSTDVQTLSNLTESRAMNLAQIFSSSIADTSSVDTQKNGVFPTGLDPTVAQYYNAYKAANPSLKYQVLYLGHPTIMKNQSTFYILVYAYNPTTGAGKFVVITSKATYMADGLQFNGFSESEYASLADVEAFSVTDDYNMINMPSYLIDQVNLAVGQYLTPAGQFTNVCSNISYVRDPSTNYTSNISAVCGGASVNLDYASQCASGSTVSYQNGALVCDNLAVPSGSYAGSCMDAVVSNNTLTALCKDNFGNIKSTSLNLSLSNNTPYKDIIDFNGTLQTGVPNGSYSSSCKNPKVTQGSNGDWMLQANCQEPGGAYETPTLDLTSCPANSNIINDEGQLICISN